MPLTRHLLFFAVLLGCREQKTDVRPEPSVWLEAGAEAQTAADPPPAPPSFDACRSIVLLDEHDDVLAFTPDAPAFTKLSHATCSVDIRNSEPRSIAVEDDGTIWAGSVDGHIVKIRARDGTCETTKFAPHQAGFSSVNLTFAGTTLWASDDKGWGGDVQPSLGLARVDRTTLKLAPIGNPERGSPWMLAGTPSGGLYGGPPGTIDRIDTSGAKPTFTELTAFDEFAKGPGVPMAYYRGAIYLFQTSMPAADVLRFDPNKKTHAVVLPATRRDFVNAAGAAMCASK